MKNLWLWILLGGAALYLLAQRAKANTNAALAQAGQGLRQNPVTTLWGATSAWLSQVTGAAPGNSVAKTNALASFVSSFWPQSQGGASPQTTGSGTSAPSDAQISQYAATATGLLTDWNTTNFNFGGGTQSAFGGS
jgi:hypothetical protein